MGIALLRGLDKEENTLSRPSHSLSALRWQLAIHPLLWADLPLCHMPSDPTLSDNPTCFSQYSPAEPGVPCHTLLYWLLLLFQELNPES